MALISKRATAGNAEGYELRRQSNGRIGLFLVGTDGTQVYIVTSASYDDGTYHLVGFTWEGTAGNAAANATIYVDGVAVALDAPVTDTLAATISNTAPFQVSGQNGTTNVLVGQADDVFVYDDLLTAGEWTTIFNSDDPPDLNSVLNANLVGYWKMGDGDTFPTLTDSGSGGNDLTMTNMESTDINWSAAGGVRFPCELATGPHGCGPLGPSAIIGVIDETPPVVGNFSPALGGTIAAQQPVSFRVTDDSGGFRRIIVHARFADGLEEVVFNGDSFRGLYGNNNSKRVIVAGGFDFTILRGGGWPQGGPVAINVFAIDQAGNEAA
jgi:hypothetical protein